MEKLIKAGLFGAGLTKLSSPEMIARYNACLKEMGIKPVDLPELSVDGMGFSPEVAAATGDRYYLSHGSQVSHLAVIVTPEQRFKPIYFPINSFDRRLLNGYFDAFAPQITDITTNVAIGLDIAAVITRFESPIDLLSVDSVDVITTSDRLIETAREQKELVAKISGNNACWADNDLRDRLIASAKTHGDLRFRQLEIPDWRFEPIEAFHTTAFGGVFVLRDLNGPDLIIIEDATHRKPKFKGVEAFYIGDDDLIDRLEKEKLVETDLSWYMEHPEILEEKRDAIIANIICANHPDADYVGMSSASRKGLIRDCQKQLPDFLGELERLIIAVSRGNLSKRQHVSRELNLILLRPAEGLSEEQTETIGRILARLQPYSLLGLFTWDKNLFYETFNQMPSSQQDWAIAKIQKHYTPIMHQLSEKSVQTTNRKNKKK